MARKTEEFMFTSRGSRWSRATKPLVVPAVAVLIWIAVAQASVVPALYLPPLGKMVNSFQGLTDALPGALSVTLQQVFLGLVFGVFLGTLAGLAFGYSRHARELFELTIDGARPVPLFALIPLFILWLGIGRWPQVALITLGVFFVMSLGTIEAVRNVPDVYVRAALTRGAKRFQVYQTVVMPSILPHYNASLRIAVAAAWGLDVAAEFSGSRAGLGYIMIIREQYLDTSALILIALIFALLAITTDRLVQAVTRRLTRWSVRSESSGYVGQMLGR